MSAASDDDDFGDFQEAQIETSISEEEDVNKKTLEVRNALKIINC